MHPTPTTHRKSSIMELRPDQTVILAAPPHARARYTEWLAPERVRAGLVAAFVLVVPGGWVVWLAWYAMRRRRGA
jgi:hypothetical protein